MIATLPMTLVMTWLFKLLPRKEQYPLPPREITMNVAEKVGVAKHLNEPQRTGLTLFSHFAYGAATGAIYAPLARLIPIPFVVSGIIFGLIVLTVSYLGLLPALRLFPPATQRPPRRNLLMITAHVVWGAFLGFIVQWLNWRL